MLTLEQTELAALASLSVGSLKHIPHGNAEFQLGASPMQIPQH